MPNPLLLHLPSPPPSHHVNTQQAQRPTQFQHNYPRVRQTHQLRANQQVHLIEINCSDTRPGQQLEMAQRQHADLCKSMSGKAVTLHTILLGVGVTYHTLYTLNLFKQLGLDHQRATEHACILHAHSVMYANKIVTIARATETITKGKTM
eukprot:1138040-Pelagomonas_calceolata.AAC.1